MTTVVSDRRVLTGTPYPYGPNWLIDDPATAEPPSGSTVCPDPLKRVDLKFLAVRL